MACAQVSQPEEISGRLLTRNWVFNLLGWVVPLSVALVAIPYVVRGLGAERFGVLSIASALLGYFGIFDLGLGRATTKFVAESLARGDTERLPKVVWTSLWSQVMFGTFGTLATVALVPVVVDRFLKISPALVAETRTSLFVLSTSLCIVLTGNALRGVLEAGQMFNVVNYIKVPTNTSMFLLPAVGVFFHLSLPGIVWLLVAARVSATGAYLAACLRFFPALRGHYLPDRSSLRPLLVYGGWVTVSNFITPLLAYVDRFFIGSLVSMSAVGYYSAPYEAINRAWVVPATLAATLFPAFTNLDAGGSKRRLEELWARSLKSLLLISAPTLLVLALFAKQVLRWWLGPEFAAQSTLTLQILAVGMLINSLALIPFSLLQGVGRPDLTGVFSLLEFLFQAGSCWILVRHFGISGAALAWTLRSLLDALLSFGAVFWLNSVSFSSLVQNGMRRTLLAVSALGVSLAVVWQVGEPFPVQVLLTSVLVLAFALVSWNHVLDSRDRDLLVVTVSQVRLALARPK
jgi:O-antigen/teichoic acid export membrane protein